MPKPSHLSLVWPCVYSPAQRRLWELNCSAGHTHSVRIRNLTLPEGKEDDWLHHEELENRAVRTKKLSCCKVEEKQSIECKTDWDVVNNCYIEVTTGHAAMTKTSWWNISFSRKGKKKIKRFGWPKLKFRFTSYFKKFLQANLLHTVERKNTNIFNAPRYSLL